jgi:hypothetical protein
MATYYYTVGTHSITWWGAWKLFPIFWDYDSMGTYCHWHCVLSNNSIFASLVSENNFLNRFWFIAHQPFRPDCTALLASGTLHLIEPKLRNQSSWRKSLCSPISSMSQESKSLFQLPKMPSSLRPWSQTPQAGRLYPQRMQNKVMFWLYHQMCGFGTVNQPA